MHRDQDSAVPHAEYARMKTHLYSRIDTLKERAERAEAALIKLIDHHHRTTVGSALHDPENQDWPDCTCLSCHGVRLLLPEQAADALAKYIDVRATDAALREAE